MNKGIKQDNFKKDLLNLIEANHQINMTSVHSVSTNNSFKNRLTTKIFNMFSTLQQLYSDSASVSIARVTWTYKGDVNSASGESWKESSSSTISKETSFNNDYNKATHNAIKTCKQ